MIQLPQDDLSQLSYSYSYAGELVFGWMAHGIYLKYLCLDIDHAMLYEIKANQQENAYNDDRTPTLNGTYKRLSLSVDTNKIRIGKYAAENRNKRYHS